jgi:hypothetical protein
LIKQQEQEVKGFDADTGSKAQLALNEEAQKDLRDLVLKVFNQFFQRIGERPSSAAAGEMESATEVDVEFQGQVVPFVVTRNTTFADLRLDASKYWYLREHDVFFTSEEGRTSAVHLLDSLVLEELYPWLNLRENIGNRKLYLVLGNFENVASKLDPFIRGARQVELDEVDADDQGNMKQEELEQIATEIKSRMRKHLLMNLVQSFLYIGLLVVWTLFLLLSKNVWQTSWMNYTIQKSMFYSPALHAETLYGVYPNFMDVTDRQLAAVRDTWSFSLYLNYLRDLLLVYPAQSQIDPGTINSHIRFFHVAELRQIRKSINNCTSAVDESFQCADLGPTMLGNTDPGLYVSDMDKESQTYTSFRASQQYTALLDVTDMTSWDLYTNTIILTSWFNIGTKAVILTFNAFCPDIAMITVVRCVFEVDRSMNILPSFTLTSFPYEPYDGTSITLQILLQVLIFLLAFLLIYDSQFLPSEMSYFAHRNNEEDLIDIGKPEDLLLSWQRHQRLPFFKRLRRPHAEEIINYVTFVFLSILQVLRLIWYFQIFKTDFEIVNDHYVDLARVSTFSEIISNFESALVLLLMVSCVKYVMFWFEKVAVMSNMLKQSLNILMRFVAVLLVPLLGFLLCFHYLIGPYSFFYSTKVMSLLGMIKAQLGTWTSNRDFTVFISPYYVAVVLGLFIFWRIAVLFLQVTSVRWELMEARKLKPTSVKKKRVVKE